LHIRHATIHIVPAKFIIGSAEFVIRYAEKDLVLKEKYAVQVTNRPGHRDGEGVEPRALPFTLDILKISPFGSK
jgi:hypothetical protein